jgi:peptidoglycan/LPS O-acetylase OafA/YrhL
MFVRREPAGQHLVWLDALKGVALLWVVLNHIVEQLAGGEYLGNPAVGWPPLAVRISQFVRPVEPGPAGVLETAVRDAGWLGDTGVTLFLIASGFGLAFARSTSARPDAATGVGLAAFVRARARRVYPLWWGAHAVLLAWLFVTWSHVGAAFWLSAAGIRCLPGSVYAFVPAWWYVGLLLQLYLLFPLLWAALIRAGPARVLAGACAVGFVARAAGLFAFGSYVDAWSRGAICVTRLPEFALGACLARWYAADPVAARALVRRPATRAAALGTFALGLVCAFTLAGMIVAPFLLGAGAFVLFAGALGERPESGPLAAVGRASYPLYLVHQPFVTTFLPAGAVLAPAAVSVRIAAVLVGTIVAARALEALVSAAGAALRRLRRDGVGPALARTAVVAAMVYLSLLAADRAAATFDPLEITGWGERPSLQPDPRFGWTLVPDRTTRLRWTTYDYEVRSNALGFPGRGVPTRKPRNTLRVLVTGDAFTSGEGVGTDAAWPRLLEGDLARRLRRNVQVLNFAVTGYGPDQEARVLRAFVPRYRPDVVVLESFVNAFEKLGRTDAGIVAEIGFGRPPSDGLATTLRLDHLRAFTSESLLAPLRERLTGRPSPEDAGFADASAFERDDPNVPDEVAAYRARLRAVRDVARAAGSRFEIVMIPSRSQVCHAADFPRGAFLDLGQPRFDAERPQRDAAHVARTLGIRFIDARPALAAGNGCPYQRGNMHFRPTGDVLLARVVAGTIAP